MRSTKGNGNLVRMMTMNGLPVSFWFFSVLIAMFGAFLTFMTLHVGVWLPNSIDVKEFRELQERVAMLTPAAPASTLPPTVSVQPMTTSPAEPDSLSLNSLTVFSAAHFQGNVFCDAPLWPSCIDISGQTCSIPVNAACMPKVFPEPWNVSGSITINGDLHVTGSIVSQNISHQDLLVITDTLGCNSPGAIDPECLDISNKPCPVDCARENATFTTVTITGALHLPPAQPAANVTLGDIPVICPVPLPSSCISIDGHMCSIPVDNSCVSRDQIFHNVIITGSLITPNNMTVAVEQTTTDLLVVDSFLLINGTANCTHRGALDASCVDLSGYNCAMGPMYETCIPEIPGTRLSCNGGAAAIALDCLPPTVNSVNGLTGALVLGIANASFLELVTTSGSSLLIRGTGSCGSTPLDPTCIPPVDISQKACPGGPINANCVQIDGETCFVPISDSCTPARIKTINGVSPLAGSQLDFTIRSNSSWIVVTNEPGGTVLDFEMTPQQSNMVMAGPPNARKRASASPTFRHLVIEDLPPFVAGANIQITPNGTGLLFSSNYSVSLAVPISEFSVSGSPIIGPNGTLVISKVPQVANTVWAGPVAGGIGMPTFRMIVPGDLPTIVRIQTINGQNPAIDGNFDISVAGPLTLTNTTNGVLLTAATAAVNNISLSVPTSEFVLAGSPISGPNGALVITKANQVANTVWAGPSSGSAAAPTFRPLAQADIPPLNSSSAFGSGTMSTSRGGTGSSTPLVGNRLLVSNPSGSSIVEMASALTNGQLVIGSTGAAPVVGSLNGTINQVIVTPGAGTLGLSLPQNIHTGATPIFAGITLGTTTLTAAASAARAYTLPDAGANANLVLNTAGALVITNTPNIGDILYASATGIGTWIAPSVLMPTVVKSVTAAGTAAVTSTNSYVALNTVTLPSVGNWQCSFEGVMANAGLLGITAVGVDMRISSASTSGIDASFRLLTGGGDVIAQTSAEVAVSTAPLNVYLEWRNSAGTGLLGSYVTKSTCGRSLRCWKSA